jgi:CheY-like chemotaxis protein/HPt (histidine-containing phosphotransfer) domain-containing protein
LGTYKILLTEDNLVNQKVACKMLERLGATVVVANNGREAIAELEHGAFDLVLMDCQMPEMDGYAATSTWRELERATGAARTPVVALTANALQGEREKCLAAGMDDYLSKPFSLTDLTKVLSRWLAPRPQAPEPAVKPWDCQAAIERLDGDAQLLEDLKTTFIDEATKRVAVLRGSPDPELIYETVHILKGMAGHFFAKRVMALADQLEPAAKAGAMAPGDPLLNEFVAAVTALIEALKTD